MGYLGKVQGELLQEQYGGWIIRQGRDGQDWRNRETSQKTDEITRMRNYESLS